jgi:hypothetical protein
MWSLEVVFALSCIVSDLSMPVGTNDRSEGRDVPGIISLYETHYEHGPSFVFGYMVL